MKNKLAISLIAASVITGSAFADMATVSGLTTTKKDCDNGSEGFTVEIKRSGTSQYVAYDSCSQEGMSVVASAAEVGGEEAGGEEPVVEELSGDTIFIDELNKDVYFPNGYTEPTVEAGNTCETGFTTADVNHMINSNDRFCTYFVPALEALSDGYLNMVSAEGSFHFTNSGITDISALANLTLMEGAFFLDSNNIDSVIGLSNLQKVSNDFTLSNNPLESLDGLDSLEKVYGILNISNTDISDVNGLSALTQVSDTLILNNNPYLNDLSGLNNLAVVSSYSWSTEGVQLDDRDYAVKLDANSYLCQNYETAISGVSSKSYVCYE